MLISNFDQTQKTEPIVPDRLKDILEEKYDLICFEPLSGYNQDTSAIYKIFHQLHQEYYEPNQRLVFWTSTKPTRKLIDHIKHAADVIDISQCFILICGPTSDYIEESIEFLDIIIDAPALPRDSLIDLDTFCPLPFFHLAVMTQGSVKACCVSDKYFGSATTSSLEDLFFSDYMKELRHKFISGQRATDCSHCWKLEDHKIQSNRQWHLDFYKRRVFTENWIDDLKIRSLDIRPSNVCNFKCRICQPVSSSLLAEEAYKFSESDSDKNKIKSIMLQGRWFDDDPEFFQQISDLVTDLAQIDFYGGEPFLLKQLPRLLEQAVFFDVAKNIRLHFNTNGSVWPSNIIDILSTFKEVDIVISVDNIGQAFELERGGTWQQVENNVSKFISMGKPFCTSIMPTVNIQNIYYLPDLIEWAQELNARILFNYLDSPECFNIDYMTEKAKKLVLDRFANFDHPELKKLAGRIIQSPGSDGTLFVEQTKLYDQYRKQDFRNTHKEIAEAMGYVLN